MPFEYDYERFEELLKHHLEAMWRDPDELEIGENISDVAEVKIIFDGYGDLETDDEYIEGGNKNMESYAIFIHKNALAEGFEFPEHDMTPWALIHRPAEEVCVYAWYDVEKDYWEILDLEDRLRDTELNVEEVMEIMEGLHERYFKPIDFNGELAPSTWPFPTGEPKK
jgi:hypothetical protein